MLNQPGIRTVIAISLGAIAGALSRYYLGLGLNHVCGTALPYGTFIVNVSGCFVMGLLAPLSLGPVLLIQPELRLLLLTGFLGSYTTFSSYELESVNLLGQGHVTAELVYWLGSAGIGCLSLQLGINLAEWGLRKFDIVAKIQRDRDGTN